MNTRITYIYRDASNYKQWQEVILQGAIEEEPVRSNLWEGRSFIPSCVGLPRLQDRFGDMGFAFPTGDDHPWHEIEDIEWTEDVPTLAMTAVQFLRLLSKCHKAGWAQYALNAEMELHGATETGA